MQGLVLLSMLAAAFIHAPQTGSAPAPQTVTFPSGALRLYGFVYHPASAGPHPVVVYLLGVGEEYDTEVTAVAHTYTDHGYVVFVPFRRGQGLSAGQGESMRQRLLRIQKTDGTAAARETQVHLMETEQIDDVKAAFAFVPRIADADPRRIVVAGNSFGGALTLLVAAENTDVKAAVASATAAQAWGESPEMREALLNAARHVRVPVYLFQAGNDFNIEPTQQLGAALGERPHVAKIYPAYGSAHMDGHHFGYLGGALWGPDVFGFLDRVLNAK